MEDDARWPASRRGRNGSGTAGSLAVGDREADCHRRGGIMRYVLRHLLTDDESERA